jgi:exodeoxyribonuclease V gamma subunit
MSSIYVSNELEELMKCLKEKLFDPSLPVFAKKMVIVPNQAMKKFLMVNLAKDPTLNVVAGVQFVTLSQALRAIEGKRIPSGIELSLLIERELHKNWDEDVALSRYLSVAEEVRDRRIVQLSDQLGSAFMRYGIYGGEELARWEKEGGWQQKIWREIFSNQSMWSYPVKELKGGREVNFFLHGFGFSFLPKVYFDFLQQSGCCFYFLSPCQYFWSDLSLENEEESNRLLLNLGKACRHLARSFEESSSLCEAYSEREGSSLKNIQASLLHLSEVNVIDDDSVQLHAASSKWHEIEILFEFLCGQLQTLEPKEIKVMAPNINDYLPFIHMVFKDQIPYVIYECEGENTTDFFHGLIQLLDLPSLRFEKRAVLKLLQIPSFLDKAKINQAQVFLIEKWVNEANISWGMDRAHRQSYIQGDLLEKSEMGTWKGGLDDLLEELVTASSCRSMLEFSDAELFGKFAVLIESLKEDLLRYGCGKKRLSTWVTHVKELAEKYFAVPEEGYVLFRELGGLALIDMEISYESFSRALVYLSRKRESFQNFQLQAIQFGGIAGLSSIPTKVTCLLGMQEGGFPRAEEPSSFARVKWNHMISKIDEDHAHFLEALLSSRENLWMSYVNIDELDGKQTGVCSVVGLLKLEERVHALQMGQKKTYAPLLRELYEKVPLKEVQKEKEVLIDMRHLNLLAKHPIQFYFNRILQVYFDKVDETDPEFTLSYLNKSILRRSALQAPLEQLVHDEKRRLPQGVFTKLALMRVAEEVQEIQESLDEMQVKPHEVFSLDFKLGCVEPFGNVRPPLRIPLGEGRFASIFGTLTDLTPNGMISHGTHQLKDVVKAWPLYLIYLNVFGKEAKELVPTKSGKTMAPVENAEERLVAYIHYFEKAQCHVSPLMPEWASGVIKGNVKELEKAIASSFRSSFFPDQYIDWIAMRDPLPNAEVLIDRWTPLLRSIYDFV